MRLPSLPEYLRQVWELGVRSLRPALPALAFLYFYRLGVGTYVALSDSTYPLGRDAMASILPVAAIIASIVPLLLLIYTPFLPLQDSILEGRPIGFLAAIRRVFEMAWPFTLAGLAQAVVLFAPLMVLCVLAGLMLPAATGTEADASRLLVMSLVILAGFGWAMISGVLLMFATPAVVLDGEGPVQSIRTSLRLVFSNAGGILGRFLAFTFLFVVLYIVGSLPAGILKAAQTASGVSSAPLKIAAVIWTSAVLTAAFPFGVAALMVLYRALVPRAAGPLAAAPVAREDDYGPATPANAPFE
jgi:hypothetical protein